MYSLIIFVRSIGFLVKIAEGIGMITIMKISEIAFPQALHWLPTSLCKQDIQIHFYYVLSFISLFVLIYNLFFYIKYFTSIFFQAEKLRIV